MVAVTSLSTSGEGSFSGKREPQAVGVTGKWRPEGWPRSQGMNGRANKGHTDNPKGRVLLSGESGRDDILFG